MIVKRTRNLDNNSNMAKSKTRGKRKRSTTNQEQDLIVIDETAGLIFESENELFGYFAETIEMIENEYHALRSEKDFTDQEQLKLEKHLEQVLDNPDEVWQDEKTFSDVIVHSFIKNIVDEKKSFYYVALAYVSTEDHHPTFIFTHFPTKDPELLKNYQRGEMVYDRRYEQVQPAALEGDSLIEGDPLAMGLYQAMIKVRSEKDITVDKFKDYADLREETIESADEIWRKNDLEGNVLVSFIKEFPEHEAVKDLVYVAVTQEDEDSNVHALLFSFPTTDKTLVDRYRQGENLQAEEIVQESSH